MAESTSTDPAVQAEDLQKMLSIYTEREKGHRATAITLHKQAAALAASLTPVIPSSTSAALPTGACPDSINTAVSPPTPNQISAPTWARMSSLLIHPRQDRGPALARIIATLHESIDAYDVPAVARVAQEISAIVVEDKDEFGHNAMMIASMLAEGEAAGDVMRRFGVDER